ncbi:MAG: TIGR04423 family type III CRISPR-associated protein [Bacteroidales bacterium]|nr:TIGR04423 family type III CRISPR-associated protein [Bacteroidales bacterium]MDY0141571.1 TIGR04423 family type III CRISPR-associated protein [Bacteroidales bacterium]
MKKIEKSKYEGYIWWSNKSTPEVLKNAEYERELIDGENPFVVEAQLCDGLNSISVKYSDGEYLVNKFDVSAKSSDSFVYSEQKYIANFDKVLGLQFRQYWREKEDNQCNNMKVLQPAELVFVGFTKNNKEE